ncbi:M20 family metallopeptidase [Nocardioides sp. YIM 152315]|uniref:M20 family metallopeptidase n=1 Tax=Nocardioides sp. YIM 152315 TaxID=3031760 RepID=UPI0023DC3A8A|nr:M20 family metallopeptidase [Nocardioides sp. YIM 152315]MDF1604525.1 M20 family metallopeptidase [Nocardioides sp. YIM 152315]
MSTETTERSTEDERQLRDGLARLQDQLLDLSHRIHARPELRYEEHFASALLVEALAGAGFAIEQCVADLPTAFLATHDTGRPGPTVAIFCEYDALEEIGHGCGHNLIAAAGLGSGLLAREWLVAHPEIGGRLVVVGSPAEEGGGGKIAMLESGCLDGIDAAMMIHPSGENLSAMRTLSRAGLEIEFEGRAAHAAVSPQLGINALDAAVLTLNAIGLLRQQLPSDARVHGIITDGGEAQNIIPERTRIVASVRTEDPQLLLENVQPRVENCARGAALATGATVEIRPTAPVYAAIRPNPVLGDLVEHHFARLGRRTEPPRTEVYPGSTDMGNVSQVIPSIHPTVEIVPGLDMHSRRAAELAGGPDGDRCALDGALLLAMTAVALFARPELVDEARRTFEER